MIFSFPSSSISLSTTGGGLSDSVGRSSSSMSCFPERLVSSSANRVIVLPEPTGFDLFASSAAGGLLNPSASCEMQQSLLWVEPIVRDVEVTVDWDSSLDV